MLGPIILVHLTIIPKISILILLLELQSQIGIIGGIKTKILSTTGYITTINNLSFYYPLEGLLPSMIGLPVLKTLLLISSILSLIIGSLLGLAQIKIKRLLAYSIWEIRMWA